MKNSIISSLEFTEIKEVDQVIWYWFYFKASEIDYHLMLVRHTEDPTCYLINGVFHEEKRCPLCSERFVSSEGCPVLNKEAEELVSRLIRQSENRLRWVTKTIQSMGVKNDNL